MKILLTGAGGQIGSELVAPLRDLGTLVTVSHAEMDLTDPDRIRHIIRAIRPDLIVNAAAYTDVERAETETELAMRINGEAPAVMAQEAQRLGAALIHYSTDYVFDGSQATPYDETAIPNPLNAYGRSKLAGELGIAQYCGTYWILRCSWIHSTHGKNFLKTIWRLAQERDELYVVNDQIGAPTWARSIAGMTAGMLASIDAPDLVFREKMRATAGIFHLSAAGTTSWHGMAIHILRRMKQARIATRLEEKALFAIPTSAYPTSAQRPLNSCLSTVKTEAILPFQFPHWREDLDICVDRMIQLHRFEDRL